MGGLGMLGSMSTVLYVVSALISIACIVGAVFIYKAFVSTCSFGEFMQMVQTEGYIKSLFRFDTLVSPKILQFFYGLSALGIIGFALMSLIVSVFLCIDLGEIRFLLGGIVSCILIIIIGEILVRIFYELSILFFKMNDNLKGIREGQGSRGAVEESATAIAFESASAEAQPQASEPAPAMKFCPNCGVQNKTSAKFCKGCGSAL